MAWIPNAVTLLNLFCGCAAIICLLDYRLMPAFWFLFAAGIADFADGLVARALGVSSEHGKELDSLADMVSFGVAPAMIYYVLLQVPDLLPAAPPPPLHFGWSWAAAPALLLALFSALRLAKFNLDTRQSENFVGVATPTSTLYAAGLLLIHVWYPEFNDIVLSPWVLLGSVAAFSYLLVSEHPMFSFKLKGTGWKGNETRYIFAALAIGLLLVLRAAAFPFIVGVYLIINLISPPTTGPQTTTP